MENFTRIVTNPNRIRIMRCSVLKDKIVCSSPDPVLDLTMRCRLLRRRMSVEASSETDLSYAPPFGLVWDPLLTAANQLMKKMS